MWPGWATEATVTCHIFLQGIRVQMSAAHELCTQWEPTRWVFLVFCFETRLKQQKQRFEAKSKARPGPAMHWCIYRSRKSQRRYLNWRPKNRLALSTFKDLKIWRAHDSMIELAYQHIFLLRVLLGKNDTKSKRRGTDCVHLTQKNSLVWLSHQQRLGWNSAESYSLNVIAGHEVLLQISAQKKCLSCHNATDHDTMIDEKAWWNSLSRSSPSTNWKWTWHFPVHILIPSQLRLHEL